MKIQSSENAIPLHTDPFTGKTVDHIIQLQQQRQRPASATPRPTTVEDELASRIFREGNGKGLIKFCRELSVILIRQYLRNEDAAGLRNRTCDSLVATLKCSSIQAQCLIDLALELIHAKVHGKYRRSNVELSYLIATATGAVADVGCN